MNKNKKANVLKKILVAVISYSVFFLLNNIRNIINILMGIMKDITFISFPIIISLIIFLFYIYKIKKKNYYVNLTILIMLLFFNICNGVLYSSKINTFFFLYIIILIFTFRLYLKNSNFSVSLIMSFSIMILITIGLGMVGLLKIIKYILPLYATYNIICIVYQNNKEHLKNKIYSFFDKNLLIFSVLIIIAICGGLGRYVHTYDEYSHWAYDAKAVIYYDKLSSSKEIMSQTRSYAPIITCWHYIIAQYSEFSEQNLYIGLAIFISIFLMGVISIDKKSKYSYIAIIIAFASCFIFGGVYSFNNLYADLAFGVIFGTTIITYLKYKEKQDYKNLLILMLIILTLIKPSGCTASFTVLLYIICDQIFINKKNKNKIRKTIQNFIKEYWMIILCVMLSFIIWNLYIKICNNSYTVFYDIEIRPWTLKADINQKLNTKYVYTFVMKILNSLDETLISSTLNISTYQFLIIILMFIVSLCIVNKEKKGKIVNIIFSYLIFFALTVVSIFIMLSYYEASIIASFGRYLNSIHIAIILVIIYYILNNINKKYINIIGITFTCFILISCSFKNITYFITDIDERIETHKTYNERSDKFKIVNENTKEDSKIFVIDQQDKDGIMAMWYARYYLFPRKVSASSSAITWKILTENNIDDLQEWGLDEKKFQNTLKKYKFDYLYLYSKDDLFYEKTKDLYKLNNYKKYNLYKIKTVNDKIELINVE